MSPRFLNAWGTWQQTRNSLVLSLSLNIEERNRSTPGSTQEKKLNRNIDATLKDMQEHSISGLRMVDLAIADSSLIQKIKSESKAAKKEADRIKNATRTVAELTALTQKLTRLVKLFSLL